MKKIGIIAPAAVFVLLVASALGLVYGLQVGGAADPRPVADPGVIVRFMLPISRGAVNLSLAVTLGALIMCVWGFSTREKEYSRAMDIAAAGAFLNTVASATTAFVTYLDTSGQRFGTNGRFTLGLMQFLTDIELGQLWSIETIIGAVTATLALACRGRVSTLLPLAGAVGLLIPLAEQGHAAGASNHSLALNSVFLHITGAAIWIGGLLTLIILARGLDLARLSVLTKRYSTLALFCFLAVASSGVVNSIIRLETPEQIFTERYGQLLIAKTVTLLVLGVFGAWQRTRIIPRLETGRRAFVYLVVLELLVMGLASGIAAALGRTETPRSLAPARDGIGVVPPAEWLTGDPLPPEFDAMKALTAWKFDLLWVLVSIFALVLYAIGVWRLVRRGDRWPIGRVLAWVAGVGLLFYTSNGFMNAYEEYMFSVHMMGHMLYTMAIPLLLVLGAPVTLIMRAAVKRRDGSWGMREWAMWLVETRYAKIVTQPLFAAVMFAGSLWVFYFSPMLRWAMSEHEGHQYMIVHFVLSGYFFALTMVGVDPVPKRLTYAMRIITLLVTMSVHAFFGVTIMSSTGLFAADWFGAMGRTWGAPPLIDQQQGGGIAWSVGEIPTLMLTVVVTVQWWRTDEREQRRKDRAADRDHDAELRAYNEMLQARANRGRRISSQKTSEQH